MLQKKLKIITAISIIIGAVIILIKSSAKSTNLPIVAIANYGPHVTLQEPIDVIKEQLANNIEIKIADVNFEQILIIQMLHKLIATKPNIIITMGTPITQAAKNLIKNIPILFVNVTDPITAGIDLPGVADRQDLKIFIDFIKKLMPKAQSIGLLYATSEANDIALVKMMKNAADLYNMQVLAVPVEHARDIPLRMHLFNNKVDLIYVGVSGTIQPSLPAIVKEADQMKIPVFNINEDAVLKHYVVGSFGLDYRKIGLHAVSLIKRVLAGEQAKNIKIIYPDPTDFHGFISKKRAQQFGITIPANLDNVTIIE